ncbi:8405_t:CDS:2, partial [Dentiscutata erythropus]
HEWSLLDFLLFRQQCIDFHIEKIVEHNQYVRSLANIINWEQASSGLIKQANDALSRVQPFGWGCDLLATNIPDCDWGCINCDSVIPSVFNYPTFLLAWMGLKGQ